MIYKSGTQPLREAKFNACAIYFLANITEDLKNKITIHSAKFTQGFEPSTLKFNEKAACRIVHFMKCCFSFEDLDLIFKMFDF